MWQDLKLTTVFDHPVLRVEKASRRRVMDGYTHDFVLLRSPDWVNVIPLTSDGQVVLIRQWRQGSGSETLEIPGGLVDPGETPLIAGERELAEETGYSPARIELLGSVSPNQALFDNRCYTCLAWDCHPDGPPRPEDTEDIEVVTAPLKQVPELIRNGEIDHSLVVSAFALFWLHQPGLAPGV